MKRNIFYLLPLFLFLFFQCTEPPEPEAEIFIFPSPHGSAVSVQINVTKPTSLKIYLYGVENDIENPVIDTETSPGASYTLHIPGKSGSYYMDVVLDGKAKRFKLIKDETL